MKQESNNNENKNSLQTSNFSPFGNRTTKILQNKDESNEYINSITGTLESEDSYKRELTDQIESAKEESYYNLENEERKE